MRQGKAVWRFKEPDRKFPISAVNLRSGRRHLSAECAHRRGEDPEFSALCLAHAARWNKSRIIFTAPLLTILDQNAEVIKEHVGDNSIILEHHSNLVHPREETEELNVQELLMEDWSAPLSSPPWRSC